jgi:hypothetical protein
MRIAHSSCQVCRLQYANDELDPATATLWFAGKQLLPEKHLSDYLGRNDKVKAIVKLQKKGQGAPGREPVNALPAQFSTCRRWPVGMGNLTCGVPLIAGQTDTSS